MASSIYYSAAWTECGCFTTCWHLHRTVIEAVVCIRSAGGYVVAVQDGTMRSLTAAEESEFQSAVTSSSTGNPTLEAAGQLVETLGRDAGFAIMNTARQRKRDPCLTSLLIWKQNRQKSLIEGNAARLL